MRVFTEAGVMIQERTAVRLHANHLPIRLEVFNTLKEVLWYLSRKEQYCIITHPSVSLDAFTLMWYGL